MEDAQVHNVHVGEPEGCPGEAPQYNAYCTTCSWVGVVRFNRERCWADGHQHINDVLHKERDQAKVKIHGVVTRSAHGDGLEAIGFQSHCLCGWIGPLSTQALDADDDGRVHMLKNASAQTFNPKYHILEGVHGEEAGAPTYEYHCRCGWVSGVFNNREFALAQAQFHISEMRDQECENIADDSEPEFELTDAQRVILVLVEQLEFWADAEKYDVDSESYYSAKQAKAMLTLVKANKAVYPFDTP